MPDDKKSQRRNDPKEQRRQRNRRHEQNAEKKTERMEPPKVQVTEPQKSVAESPGPEFYKNLKRETDEILKITEEENTKYKKKEILSNWSKYEMPIESYEEIEEQENMGADYETLIQASMSVGGHFQFKHEKSWDENADPTPYDEYFEINMENLNLAVCTIPFYERNSIDPTIFNETDLLNMKNRATRFNKKYFNNMAYTTPEIDAQERILQNLMDDFKTSDSEIEIQEKILDNLKENLSQSYLTDSEADTEAEKNNTETINSSLISQDNTDKTVKDKSNTIDFEFKEAPFEEKSPSPIHDKKIEEPLKESIVKLVKEIEVPEFIDPEDDIIFGRPGPAPSMKEVKVEAKKIAEVKPTPKVADNEQKQSKNPVIESPEDLEKWLDDFLDG